MLTSPAPSIPLLLPSLALLNLGDWISVTNILIPCYSLFGCTHTSHNRTEALEHSALHITFYLCLSLRHLTLGHALDGCYHHRVCRYVSSIITFTTCSN